MSYNSSIGDGIARVNNGVVRKKLYVFVRKSNYMGLILDALLSGGYISGYGAKENEREFRTKITQMPFVDASGKSSYPDAIKQEMFKHAYESFSVWHQDVFFYLCMEDHEMWKKTFGYEHSTNNDFERAMLARYCEKLNMEFQI